MRLRQQANAAQCNYGLVMAAPSKCHKGPSIESFVIALFSENGLKSNEPFCQKVHNEAG